MNPSVAALQLEPSWVVQIHSDEVTPQPQLAVTFKTNVNQSSSGSSSASTTRVNTAGLSKEQLSRGPTNSKYTCPLCGKSNRDNSDLRRHFMIHTGEKPFHCSHCNYRTAQRRSLQLHMMRAHHIHEALSHP